MPRHRPTIDDWTAPERLLRVQSLAMHGYNHEELAKEMGISRRTLERWMVQDPRLKQAVTNGGEAAVAAVENALFKKAQSGDLGAMCFFLKNRAPKHWSEHPELRGYDGKVVFIDDIPKTAPIQPTAETEKTE